jgi:23S rRNA (uracil1939-C5)-methyltransferase
VTAEVSCPHAATCGGCPLIHLPYAEQLKHKHARVVRCLGRYEALARVLVRDVTPAEPRAGYRTRAKLMVGPDGELGLFGASGGHRVVDVPGCIVLSPVLARVAQAVRAAVTGDVAGAQGSPLAPARSLREPGLVAIDIRELRPPTAAGADEARALVTWVVRRGPSFRLERLRDAAVALTTAVPEVAGVAVNFHEGQSPQVLGEETMLLCGQGSGLDVVGASTHKVTFGSFVQAHRGQAGVIHRKIAEAVFASASGAPRVLDLYGGSGAISVGLAARGADVLLVESFGPAVDQARETARTNSVTLRALCGDAAEVLGQLERGRERFDAVIVNPPRRGVDPTVRVRLAQLAPRLVVYVSCQPETLARDLDHLARLGLRATEVTPVDMIPLTEEVESVALLAPAPVAAPRVIYEDAEVVIVDKPPHEPTTPHPEHATSLLGRVQQLPGARDAVAVHRLDVGTSGVVVFAKDASRVEAWSRALHAEGGRKTYVAAVKGEVSEGCEIDRPVPVDGKNKPARTSLTVEGALGEHTIVRAEPHEGRTHQIRRHLAGIGHPVLGDARYGHAATNRFMVERHGLDRTFLHAARLELRHPRTGERLVLEAPLPGDLTSVVDSIEGDGRTRGRSPDPKPGRRSRA